MKRLLIFSVLVLSIVFMGCGPKKVESYRVAINTAKAMETVEEKASYLISQTKAFYNSKEFDQAVQIAQYILRHVDRDSKDAKSLLEKAKAALKKAAEAAAADAKKKIGNFGK